MNCSNNSLYFEGLLDCFEIANGRGLKNDDVLLDVLDDCLFSFLRAYDTVGCFKE